MAVATPPLAVIRRQRKNRHRRHRSGLIFDIALCARCGPPPAGTIEGPRASIEDHLVAALASQIPQTFGAPKQRAAG
jgi:hypothetical protein